MFSQETIQPSYNQVLDVVATSRDRMLQQIKTLKPHMYQMAKTLLKTAPVSLYLFLQSAKKNSQSTSFADFKSQLPKQQAVIMEEDQQNSLIIEAPDKTESYIEGVRLDTSQTDGEDIYTLNIFWKKSVIDLNQIDSPIIAFLVKGIDLLYKSSTLILNNLQQQFLQKNLTPILKGKYLEDSQQISLFREQPILPKRLLMDFFEKLQKSTTQQILQKFSVAKDILQIWIISLLCQQDKQKLPSGDQLFLKLAALFNFQVIKIKKTFKFIKDSSGFQLVKLIKGYRVQSI